MSERWKRGLVPLSWYLGVTVAVPVLNGAMSNPGFAEHAATVVVVGCAAAWAYSRG